MDEVRELRDREDVDEIEEELEEGDPMRVGALRPEQSHAPVDLHAASAVIGVRR
jgi:hypothetical protein